MCGGGRGVYVAMLASVLWLGISGASVVLHRFGLIVLFIFVICCASFFVLGVPLGIRRCAYVRVMLRLLVPRVLAFWFRGFRFGDV